MIVRVTEIFADDADVGSFLVDTDKIDDQTTKDALEDAVNGKSKSIGGPQKVGGVDLSGVLGNEVMIRDGIIEQPQENELVQIPRSAIIEDKDYPEIQIRVY